MPPVPSGVQIADIPAMAPAPDGPARSLLAYRAWEPTPDAPVPTGERTVLLLHGSPGSGADFDKLATELSSAGYHVIAPDLPGFGHSTTGFSSLGFDSGAHAVLALMDFLGVQRAHVVGWSNGGGVALHMADSARDRVQSLTMLASIGVQEQEGSGSYAFEHAKYAVGIGVLGAIPELIPHFGLLGTPTSRTAWLRNFWDGDQRPLRGIMERMSIADHPVPVLILHGRDDVLISWRAAAAHHNLLRHSELVIIRANHFLPFMQPHETAVHLRRFFDDPSPAFNHETRDLAPLAPRRGIARSLEPVEKALRAAPWWAQSSLIGKVTLVAPTLGIVACAIAVSVADVDFCVALLGALTGLCSQTLLLIALGRWRGQHVYAVPFIGKRLPRVHAGDWSRRMRTRAFAEGWLGIFLPSNRLASLIGATTCGSPIRHLAVYTFARLLASFFWTITALLTAMVSALLVLWPLIRRFDLLGAAIGVFIMVLLVSTVPALLTRRGRQHLAASIGRLLHHEYWPTTVLYLPVVVHAFVLGLRRGGLNTVTCCNPGIQPAGGWAGEAKHAIMAALPTSPLVLATELIPRADPQERVRLLREAMARRPELASFPVVLKPDEGQRGHAFKVARSPDDARTYFESMIGDAVVQPFHPGPHECGILWIRTPGSPRGSIYSITDKVFPEITGDGVRTLESLIWDHPRYRRQARVFLSRFAHDASRVPENGEIIRLGVSGNHCQGTLFRDGEHLCTPELEQAIDSLASGFAGGGLDIGRFDIRYENVDDLRRGVNFAIVELNGVTSESTNMYDPTRGFVWAYGVLLRQWTRMYNLGAERRNFGVRPISVRELISVTRAHFRRASGNSIAD